MEQENRHPIFGVTFAELYVSKKSEKEFRKADDSWGKKISLPVAWKDANKAEYPKEPYRVCTWIPMEGFTIWASPAGERKSWMGMEAASCITQNKDFLGDPRFKTIGCNVLYVDCENAQSELQRRGRQLGFVEESPFELHIFNNKEINLNTDEGEAWLYAAIEYFDYKVIFIDTLRSVAGGLKEDKAEEVRTFFNRYRPLKDMGVAVVWLDHTRKPSHFDKKIPQKEHLLGSTDKTAGVEILMMFKSEPGSEEIQVYQRKNRLGKEVEPFKVSMKDEVIDDNVHTVLRYEGEIEEKETQKAEAKKCAMEMLAEGGRTSNELLDAIGSQQKIGHKNIRAALNELVAEGQLDVGRKGRQNYYFIIEDVPLEGPLVTDEII